MDPHASSAELLNTKLERLKKASRIFAIVVICIAVTLAVVSTWRMNEVYKLIRRGNCLHTALPMSKTMENFQLVTVMCLLVSLIFALEATRIITKSTHTAEKRYGDASAAVLVSIVCLILGFIGFILFLVYRHHSHVALRDCL